MQTLRRKASKKLRLRLNPQSSSAVTSVRGVGLLTPSRRNRGHRKSTSFSSMGFVTAVKTASVSMASFSLTGGSRGRQLERSGHSRLDTSATASSHPGPRISIDSTIPPVAPIDKETLERARKRAHCLKEMLETEESYGSDLRMLVEVFDHELI